MRAIKLLNCCIAKLLRAKNQFNNSTIQQFNNGFTLIELLVARHPKPWRRKAILPGFTIIELLVVISIIGILASFVTFSFSSTQEKARDGRRKSDLNAIKGALELARSDCKGGYYPGLGQSGGLVNFYSGDANLKVELETFNYIKQLPQDPRNTEPNVYKMYIKTPYEGTDVCPEPSSGGAFNREGSLDYRLVATLENTIDHQSAESQSKCPASGFNVTYTSATYVVCAG